ncbi:MAG: tRNA (adenosine(37)-N6)-threonylcarbamoyltransferase complex dimerization subunit type 1 TsaB [SAR324 cluster bacterium]|nr:tRNA (adenosine(37)-N6)-threonylcarbamoyltransferase complex dimerization subunit type 1 TsaB [SAR324 cluster bacterium]
MTTALALDTTSDYLSVALHQEGRPAASHYAPAGTRTTATIFGVIEELLAGAGLAPEALEVFIVARGPGSFTGTRIGLAVAKTFARVLGCPLIGVDTLQLLAAQTEPVEERPFHALLNCVRDEAYHAPYRWRDGRLESLGPIALGTFASLAPQIGEAPVMLRRFEPGGPGHEEALGRFNLLTPRHPFPDGELLLRAGLEFFASDGPRPPADPIYLKSEAFRKWKR